MSEVRRASKDAAIYTLVNLVPIFLGFISIPIYTRIFNPTEYGQLSIVQMTTNYMVIFMLTWVNASFMRFYEVYKRQDKEKRFVNTYLTLLLIMVPLSVLIYGIFLVFALKFGWFNADLFNLFCIGAFLLFFNGFVNFVQTYYRAKREAFNFAIIAITNSVLTLLAGLALVMAFSFGVEGILLGSVVISAIIAIVATIIIIRRHGLSFRLFDRAMLREAFYYGSPIIFTNLATWLLRFSDRYIIGITRSVEEVGLYSVSYNISEKTILVIINAIAFAVTPILIYTWEHGGRKETEKLLEKFSRYQLIILSPAVVGLIIIAPAFTRLFVGSDFQGGALASQIVALGMLFLGLYNFTNLGLYMKKKTKTIALTTFIVGLFNVLLNLLLVPRFGYIVAAYTTTLSYFFLWIISYLQTLNILRWKIRWVSSLKIVFSVVVMCLPLIWLVGKYSSALDLTLVVLFSALVYFSTLLLLGEIKNEFWVFMGYMRSLLGGRRRGKKI